MGWRFSAAYYFIPYRGGLKWAMVIEEGKLIRGLEGVDVGDRVRVELIVTDAERGSIDVARAGRGHNPYSSVLPPQL
jgi:hypothetical protein